MALPGKRGLRKLIKKTGGTVSQMAKDQNVSRQTIYNWLDHYDMRDDLDKERTNIVMLAEDNIYDSLIAGDVGTSQWVLERKGRHLGWNKQVEISGVLGQMNLSAEQMAILEAAGYNVSEVVQQFISMLQATELESA